MIDLDNLKPGDVLVVPSTGCGIVRAARRDAHATGAWLDGWRDRDGSWRWWHGSWASFNETAYIATGDEADLILADYTAWRLTQ
jgi:hypothetical protein